MTGDIFLIKRQRALESHPTTEQRRIQGRLRPGQFAVAIDFGAYSKNACETKPLYCWPKGYSLTPRTKSGSETTDVQNKEKTQNLNHKATNQANGPSTSQLLTETLGYVLTMPV